MLTLSTQIPTRARGQVRALVKAHKDWPAYLTDKNIISASARNADLLEFARMHPELAERIAAILTTPTPAAQPRSWRPEQIAYLTAAIEHLLGTIKKRSKPRVRRQMGKAA